MTAAAKRRLAVGLCTRVLRALGCPPAGLGRQNAAAVMGAI